MGSHAVSTQTPMAMPQARRATKTISGAEHLALGEEEIKLRLKRWVAAGLVRHFEPPRERQGHINFGGKGLRDLGSDGSWGDLGHAELDAILAPG